MMPRSFSPTSTEHQHYHCSSTATHRYLPVRLVCNNNNDHHSSDNDSQYQTYLQRASSTSSFSSINSASSANYRILPVRYSSIDRIIPKPPTATANERGINVRIHFDRPHHHHYHHKYRHRHCHQHSINEFEFHRRKHMTKEKQHYGSCPVLDGNSHKSAPLVPSNITYIETRSIVRASSNDRLHKNDYSNSMVDHKRSAPQSPIANTRIKLIPLDTNFLSTRVIQEKKE